MKNKILIKALSRFSIGMILLMMLIFIPAGSLSFINGWIFLGLLFIPMLAVGIFLMIKNPSLLEKRLNSKSLYKSDTDNYQIVFIEYRLSRESLF